MNNFGTSKGQFFGPIPNLSFATFAQVFDVKEL
jgi:hypothetical protein